VAADSHEWPQGKPGADPFSWEPEVRTCFDSSPLLSSSLLSYPRSLTFIFIRHSSLHSSPIFAIAVFASCFYFSHNVSSRSPPT